MRKKKKEKTLSIKSSCGNGEIANKGFPRPGRKKFVSKVELEKSKEERRRLIREAREA